MFGLCGRSSKLVVWLMRKRSGGFAHGHEVLLSIFFLRIACRSENSYYYQIDTENFNTFENRNLKIRANRSA